MTLSLKKANTAMVMDMVMGMGTEVILKNKLFLHGLQTYLRKIKALHLR